MLDVLYALRRDAPVLNASRRRAIVLYAAPLILAALWLSFRDVHADDLRDGTWYLGAGVGSSSLSPDTSQSELRVTKGQQGSLKLSGGYDINRRWSLEAFYADLGAAKLANTMGFGEGGKVGYRVAGAGVVAALPDHSPGPSFLLKGGLASVMVDSDLPLEKLEDLQGYLGVGAGMQFARGLSVRGEYEYFGEDAGLLSLSLVKRFGRADPGKGDLEAVAQRQRTSLAEPPMIVPNVAPQTPELPSMVRQQPLDAEAMSSLPTMHALAPEGRPVARTSQEAKSPGPVREPEIQRTPQPAPILKLRPTDPSKVRESKTVTLRFERGSARFDAAARGTLDRAADAMEREPSTALVLAVEPGETMTSALLIERAKALGSYLQGRGVPISQMFVLAAKSAAPPAASGGAR